MKEISVEFLRFCFSTAICADLAYQSQLTLTCSKSTIAALEQTVTYIQGHHYCTLEKLPRSCSDNYLLEFRLDLVGFNHQTLDKWRSNYRALHFCFRLHSRMCNMWIQRGACFMISWFYDFMIWWCSFNLPCRSFSSVVDDISWKWLLRKRNIYWPKFY